MRNWCRATGHLKHSVARSALPGAYGVESIDYLVNLESDEM
ncbi:MAG: hypothetical protein QW780_04310 [Sulfolobales archaeon]